MNELEKLLFDNVIKIETDWPNKKIGIAYDVSGSNSKKAIVEIAWCKTKKEQAKLYNEIKKEIEDSFDDEEVQNYGPPYSMANPSGDPKVHKHPLGTGFAQKDKKKEKK